jgi:hypothetical protein
MAGARPNCMKIVPIIPALHKALSFKKESLMKVYKNTKLLSLLFLRIKQILSKTQVIKTSPFAYTRLIVELDRINLVKDMLNFLAI